MADRLVFIAWALATLAAPLAWRFWRDRTACRGLALRADIEVALRRALGGDSLVAVEVFPSSFWRRGRLALSVPPGWDWLVKAAWERIIEKLPADYDLLLCCAGAAAGRATASNTERNDACHPPPAVSRTPTSATSPSGPPGRTTFYST